MKHVGIKKGVYILPNLFTTANLFCGFFSVIRAINGDYTTAAWAILFAGVFDFLDGRVARLTRSQSRFGLEYDSLVDLASFGLAPAILAYTWTLSAFERVGWMISFVFFACGALRLARFNVQAGDVEKKTFQGLPIPGAAYVLASFVIFYHSLFGTKPFESVAVLAATFVLALLMVSNIPYRGFKGIDFKKKANFFVLVLLVGVLFVVASAPHVMIFVLSVGYAALGILEAIFHSPRQIAVLRKNLSRFFYSGADAESVQGMKKGNLKVVGNGNPHSEKMDHE